MDNIASSAKNWGVDLAPLEDGVRWDLRPTVYGFEEFEVGQSRLYPRNLNHASIGVAAYNYGKRHAMKFSVRTERAGLRVLRIS